jgi:MFS family permease
MMSGRIFYGWYVVGACFLCMLVAAGIGWFTFPVFIKPFESEFGWSRTSIMVGVAVWGVMTSVASPVLGHLVDRLGERRVMLAGAVLSGMCCLGLGSIHSLPQLYTVLVFAAVGTAATTYVPVASLIELIGWRWTFRVFAVLIWVLVTPTVAFCIRSPDRLLSAESGDASADAAAAPAAGEQASDGFSAREAIGMLSFWGIGIADLLSGIGIVGIQVHMVAFSIDAGIEPSAAALAFSLIPGVSVLAMIGVGAAADRFNKRVMITLSYGLPSATIFLLFGLESTVPLFCFAVLFGMLSAGRAALWPLVVGDCFGRRAYATVMGFLFIFYTVGTTAGPPIAGYIYDTTKSYYWAFMLMIAAFVVAGVSMGIGTMSRTDLSGSRSR